MENLPYVKYYKNIGEDKKIIIKENKKKSGIYLLRNKVNSKYYIGGSKSLDSRFYVYFSSVTLKKRLERSNSAIYSALLEYNYFNFELYILEYCKFEKVTMREQYYLDLLSPEYNILKIANSRLGSKHSEVTKLKISAKIKGKNHPFFNKELNIKTKRKISESLKSYNLNNTNKPYLRTKEFKSKLTLSWKGVEVKIIDKENNTEKCFPTITKLAKYLEVSNKTIYSRLKKGYCIKYFYIRT